MGCKGSKVRILSHRPKRSIKASGFATTGLLSLRWPSWPPRLWHNEIVSEKAPFAGRCRNKLAVAGLPPVCHRLSALSSMPHDHRANTTATRSHRRRCLGESRSELARSGGTWRPRGLRHCACAGGRASASPAGQPDAAAAAREAAGRAAVVEVLEFRFRRSVDVAFLTATTVQQRTAAPQTSTPTAQHAPVMDEYPWSVLSSAEIHCAVRQRRRDTAVPQTKQRGRHGPQLRHFPT